MRVAARRAVVAGLAVACAGCSARSMLIEGTEGDTTTGAETEPPPETGTCRSVCDCIGGAAVFVVTEPGPSGKCFNGCDDACGPGGAVENALSTREDLGRIPHCSEICARLDAAGCGPTCSDLIGTCVDVDLATCTQSSVDSFACLASTAKVTCGGGGVRFDGCDPDGLAVCNAP